MSLYPQWLVLAGALLALAGCGWLAVRRPTDRTTTLRRLAIAVLLVLVALRPAVGAGSAPARATNLDVIFVVDTTASMGAMDWQTTGPRLDGVRADVRAIVAQLSGARLAVITFSNTAQVEVPLTTDANAVLTGIDTLVVMPPAYGKGSDLDVVAPVLRTFLDDAARAEPDRERYLVYLGDGEQTVATPPTNLAGLGTQLGGATVLGYGTEAGAKIPNGYGGFVYDPSTSADGISRIDENNLRAIAANLDGDYRHRTTPDGLPDFLRGQRLTLTHADDRVPASGETYWLFALAIAVLALWELWVQAMAFRVTRRELR